MSRVLLIVFVLGLSACSSFGGKSKVDPPAEVPDFEPQLQVERLWKVSVGASAEEAAPALGIAMVGGRLYTASAKGRVVAIDGETGAELWRQKTPYRFSTGAGIGGDTMLLGTRDGEIVALSTGDGQERWRVMLSSEVSAVPAVSGGIAAVRTLDGRVVGLNLADGSRRWVFDGSIPSLTLRGTSAPVIHEGLVIAGFDNGRLAGLLLTDGQLVWEQAVSVPSGRSEIERLVDIDGDLRVLGDSLYAVNYQGNLGRFAVGTGTPIWSREISSYTGLDVGGDGVYVSDEKSHVVAFDRASGASLWTQDRLYKRQLTAPEVAGDAVVVGDAEGYLYWLSRDDGRLLARYRVGRDGLAARPLAVADILYALDRGGDLVALTVSEKD
ncbi:MAG: outer membrane protein assembly factor BamB [Pseudomonadota bacterium]|nr:outer membrane protein assembly factor BamB [Pseudomonadota bacterium]